MLQQLLIVYLSLTAVCGPVLCCCTLQVLGTSNHCCHATAARDLVREEESARHHGCAGHSHHEHIHHQLEPRSPVSQDDAEGSSSPLKNC